jgi:signal transduction histidine kinase
MSHELRTPLTAMSLAIRMLRQPNVPLERRDKYLEILEQECNKEIDLINDLLSLQRLESNQSQLQPQKLT